jgi:heme-degrading monooxygenase HmoA
MAQIYTYGRWLPEAGAETEFIRLWNDLAQWTSGQVPGSGWAVLLRDESDPRRFVSFGPWDGAEAVDAWRDSEGFKSRVGSLRGVLESFEAFTMTQVGGTAMTGPAEF